MALWKNNLFSNWLTGREFDEWVEKSGLIVSPEPIPEFVWVDVETTGLDPEDDVTLELGIVLTDAIGRVTQYGAITWPIFASEKRKKMRTWREAITGMDSFVHDMHVKSGLVDHLANCMVKPNIDGMDPVIVQWDAVQWMRMFLPQDRQLQLSGSTPHFDRAFLRADLPVLEDWFHYRTGVDVSGIREVAKRVNPSIVETQPVKQEKHRPLPDLVDSIKLYRHLLQNFVILDPRTKEYFA